MTATLSHLVETTARLLQAVREGAEPDAVAPLLRRRGELLRALAAPGGGLEAAGAASIAELQSLEREVAAAFEARRAEVCEELALLRRARGAAGRYQAAGSASARYLDSAG